MKYFVMLFLAFNAFFGSNLLVASEVTKHLISFWSGNEEELYLNISLLEGIEFADTYTIMKTTNGQGCEVICKPMQEGLVFSSEGYELQEISLTVMLYNLYDNPNEVEYTTTTRGFYQGINDEGQLVSITSETKNEGMLNNPAIDLTQEPEFFTINDWLHEGVISFRNSFPYSQVQ